MARKNKNKAEVESVRIKSFMDMIAPSVIKFFSGLLYMRKHIQKRMGAERIPDHNRGTGNTETLGRKRRSQP